MLNTNHHTPQTHPKPSSNPQTAAFFDVDGTLLPGAFAEQIFIRHLLDEKVLTWKHMTRYAISVLTGGNPFHRQAWERNKMYLKNLPADQLRDRARECYRQKISSCLSNKARTRVAEHLDNGHQVFLVSASLRWLVEPLGEELGTHGLLATQLASENGSLTGYTLGGFIYGQNKAALLRRWISWWNVDVIRSFAYSDHHSDIPMLEMVGHPVAVNPTRKMRRHATEHGWRVESF